MLRRKPLTIRELKSTIAKIATEYELERVILFGSYANGKQNRKSDIDLLVSFLSKTKKPVTYFTILDLQERIEEMTGKKVDVIPAPIPKDSLLEIGKEVLLYEAG